MTHTAETEFIPEARLSQLQKVLLEAVWDETCRLETTLEARERADRIARALAGLNERYEAVLKAKYLEQHSVADIAAAWNESPKAIESLLTRARQAFKEAYVEQGDPP